MSSAILERVAQMVRLTGLKEARSFGEVREVIKKVSARAESTSLEYRRAHNIQLAPVEVAGVYGEWITAPDLTDAPVILFLHGGGYVAGSIWPTAEWVCRISQSARTRVLGIEYSLAPESPFPQALEDALKAYRWLVSCITDPARVAILGSSAGGGLAVATLLALRDAGDPLPSSAVCLSPWVDLACTGESMITKEEIDPFLTQCQAKMFAVLYLGDVDPRTPLASPLYGDLRGLPPLLIQVGTAEVLLDDATRLADRARASGVDVTLEVWEDMIHGWQSFARVLPEGQQAIDQVGKFIREQTRGIDTL